MGARGACRGSRRARERPPLPGRCRYCGHCSCGAVSAAPADTVSTAPAAGTAAGAAAPPGAAGGAAPAPAAAVGVGLGGAGGAAPGCVGCVCVWGDTQRLSPQGWGLAAAVRSAGEGRRGWGGGEPPPSSALRGVPVRSPPAISSRGSAPCAPTPWVWHGGIPQVLAVCPTASGVFRDTPLGLVGPP